MYCSSLGKGRRGLGMAAFRLPMKPTVKCRDSLERMKLRTGSQARDEPYRLDHGGDDPSPAAAAASQVSESSAISRASRGTAFML